MKAEANMHEGIFLGIRDQGVEAFIAVDDGVVAVLTIRRRPESKRWDAQGLLRLRASVEGNPN